MTCETETEKVIFKDASKSAAKTMCEGKGIGGYAYIDEDGKEVEVKDDSTEKCSLK